MYVLYSPFQFGIIAFKTFVRNLNGLQVTDKDLIKGEDLIETDDDESEVISTDDTQTKEDEFNKCGTLFELSDNNTLITWNQYKTNEISEGVYTGSGSYIEQGWSNEGLWQLDYDIKYNSPHSSYINYYVGVMPFCSEEINPYTDDKRKDYCMESWEKSATINGMDAICIE